LENGAFRISYDANGYVELQLERLVAVQKIVVYSGNPGTSRYALKQFVLQGHNGGCYETLPSGSYNQPDDQVRTETLNLASPYVTDRIRLMVKDSTSQIRKSGTKSRRSSASGSSSASRDSASMRCRSCWKLAASMEPTA
jgi:hypothetical protein